MVSIIVVTFDVNNHLKPLLGLLKEQTYRDTEIIVIESSAGSGLNQKINERYPDIKLYPSSIILSYCEALNKGVKISRGEFVICLNDDVSLEKSFIEEALRGFEVDAKIGMVSGKVLRTGAKIIDSTGLFLSPWRTAKERGYGFNDKGQYDKEGYVFGVNGAVAFYRKKMLEEIKIGSDYFDTDYHFFYEDLDIAWRAQRYGWKGYYIPKAVAYHVRGASLRAACGINKPYARRYLRDDLHADLIKNRYLTLIKNESFPGLLLHLPFIILYDMAMWSYILVFRPKLIAVFFMNLKYLKPALNKRRLTKRMIDETSP